MFAAPALAAGASSAVSALGTVFSVASALGQASAQSSIYRQQAKLAREDAEIARATGAASAQDKGLRNAQILATLGARQAGTGFAYNSPSFQEIRTASRELGRRDQLRLATRGYNAGLRLDREAGLLQYQAQSAMTTGFFNATGSLISGFDNFSALRSQAFAPSYFLRPRARPF